jgi:WD40 repeat protein
MWDGRTGQAALPALRTNVLSRPRDMFDPFWFSPDGRWLWEVRRAACLRYDLSTGQPAGEPVTGLHRYQRPWLAPDGRHLVVSLTNGFQVLHLDRGEPMGPTIAITDDNVRALALSADGLKLATSGPDRALRVWDTTNGQHAGPTFMPPVAATAASFTSDGKGLEIVSMSIAIDTQGRSVTSQAGPARMISLEAPPPTWIANWAGVRVIGFRSDGEVLAYTRSDGTMSWRDPATGRSSLSWPVAGSREMIGSALNPEGTLVAAAFRSGERFSEIQIWEAVSGRWLEPAITWTNQGALAFSPDGQTLAGLGGYDGSGSIQLWDVASRQPRAYFPSAPKEVSWLSLWFSPDGCFIAARNSYTISVWDVATGRLATGGEIDFYLAISDDWTRALGQELLDFTDPRNPRPAPSPLNPTSRGAAARRTGMALSPDGRLRAAEAGDRTMRLWDNLTDRPVGHEMKLANLARQRFFSPDGRLLVVFEWAGFGGRAGPGMSLRLWETSTGLPCGPAIPARDLPVELLFDRDVRWLTQKAPFDTTETLLIQLPQRDLSLSEMEHQSWRLSGCRLDEAGNVEVIPEAEFLQLEAAGDRQASAGLPTAPAASPPEVSPAAQLIRQLDTRE